MLWRTGLVALVATLLLTGCVNPPFAPASPDPETPSTPPTVSVDPEPSATPPGEPAPPSSAPPAPSEAAPDSAPYCGDEYVLATLSAGPTTWVGTDAEVLELAEPRGGFEPADAIAGLDVHCTVTYVSPTDGGPGGTVTISTALLLRDDAALEQLDAWSAANGYAPAPGSDPASYGERYAPANPDGTTTTKLFWAPLDGDTPTIGDAAQVVATTGAPPDAILLWFADFTQQ